MGHPLQHPYGQPLRRAQLVDRDRPLQEVNQDIHVDVVGSQDEMYGCQAERGQNGWRGIAYPYCPSEAAQPCQESCGQIVRGAENEDGLG